MIPDEMVVDACILFSFFNKSSTRRSVFKRLLDKGCSLVSPEFAVTELSNNKLDIMKFSKIDEDSFNKIFSELKNDVKAFKQDVYEKLLSEASKISPHTKDDTYFALALAKGLPIWSDEKEFANQSSVRVFTTKELYGLL